MTKTAATLWLRAMNPIHCPRSMAEGQRSARTAVIGLGISLILNIAQTLWLTSTPAFAVMLAAQYEAMGLGPAEIEARQAMTQSIWPLVIGMAILVTVIFFGLVALIQWRRMGRAIPLVLLAFISWSVFVDGGMQLLGHTPPDAPDMPIWLQVAGIATTVVAAAIYTASLQGAILLHRLKGQP